MYIDRMVELIKKICGTTEKSHAVETICKSDKAAIRQGTFGFIILNDGPRCAVVEHIFADGRLMVHYAGNKRFHAIVLRDEFEPSRSAYFCEGSWVEPIWDGESAVCLNAWVEPYTLTDEMAMELFR